MSATGDRDRSGVQCEDAQPEGDTKEAAKDTGIKKDDSAHVI